MALAGCVTLKVPAVPRTTVAPQRPKKALPTDAQIAAQREAATNLARENAATLAHRGLYNITPQLTRVTQAVSGAWYGMSVMHLPGMGDMTFVMTCPNGRWVELGHAPKFDPASPQYGVPAYAWTALVK